MTLLDDLIQSEAVTAALTELRRQVEALDAYHGYTMVPPNASRWIDRAATLALIDKALRSTLDQYEAVLAASDELDVERLPCQRIDPVSGGSCGMGSDGPAHNDGGTHDYTARDRRNRDRRAIDDHNPARHPNRYVALRSTPEPVA